MLKAYNYLTLHSTSIKYTLISKQTDLQEVTKLGCIQSIGWRSTQDAGARRAPSHSLHNQLHTTV
jgi:hypothetical protein